MCAIERRGYGVALVFAAFYPGVTSAAETLPADFIAATTQDIAAAVAMAGPGLATDASAQRAFIDEHLLSSFDLRTSSSLILRKTWRNLKPVDQQRFVDAFYTYLVRSYGDAVDAITSDTVRVLPGQEAPYAGTARVHTIMTMNDGEQFDVDFYLREHEAEWRIVDIIVDGVSYVRTYRVDFGAEIRANGFDALVDWLNRATVAD